MQNKDNSKAKKKSNAYLKYSGIAFQLAAIIFLAIWGGQKLDEYLGNEKPLITMLLTLFFFSGYMYKLYNDLTNDKL